MDRAGPSAAFARNPSICSFHFSICNSFAWRVNRNVSRNALQIENCKMKIANYGSWIRARLARIRERKNLLPFPDMQLADEPAGPSEPDGVDRASREGSAVG